MTLKIPLFKVFMPPEADQAVLETLHSGYIAEGPKVMEFRELVRKRLGTEHVVPMSSCTMALQIAYDLAGLDAGDDVISIPVTSICTNIPFVHKKVNIIWADADPKTGMIDPKKLPEIITKKTKAIVVLHKDGDLAPMDEIMEIARAHNLKIIEDAAHVFGGSYKGKNVGTISDYACFSFQAIKHITSGDGGVLTTKFEEDFLLAKKLKWLGVDKETVVGTPWESAIDVAGYKGNMNDIAATIGIASMPHLDSILAQYRRNGKLYSELLKNLPGIELVYREPNADPTYWTYVLLAEKRDAIAKALNDAGIAAGVVHPRNDRYPVFKAFARALPGVDAFTARELSLPSGWWVSEEDIHKIVDIIKNT